MTRLRHYDHLGTARVVTFSCFHRYRLLREPKVIRAFLAELGTLRERGIGVLGYVIMPDHVHLVLLPPDDGKLGVEIARLESISAREMLPILEGVPGQALDRLVARRGEEVRRVFWQRRCYDHNCRTPETVREKIYYGHKNPVIRGLVKTPTDWPWSSYRWYMGLDGVELEIDGVEL